MTDKEKAFEYDEEFVKKLERLEIEVHFHASKFKKTKSGELRMSTWWSFYTKFEDKLDVFARIDVYEYGAHAYLSENRNIFDVLNFQAAMEVLTLIADKEKQLNEILKNRRLK